ncbi:hypothetical protein OPQ81_011082 [Rhizoctonia solani]|nr:hypothetical protein OPQ81_011082 [Rhizoctonia solani]
MSRLYSSQLWSEALGAANDITEFVQLKQVAQDIYEEAGLGGSADIFSGNYTKKDGSVIKVAIKCIRAFTNDRVQIERLQKKFAREFKVWHTLSGGSNVIQLLGIISGIGPLPALVCELCPGNLQDYLERKTPPPRHTKMMADTLRGLSYMHGLDSGPIAHGDIKLSNILVTSDETALICDFGRSRHSVGDDQSNEVMLSSSSSFGAADMWAYGCVALEILCRIQPYNEATSDVVVAELIRSGRPPSDRPRGPRGSLINDSLWNVLSSCWQTQHWRPTAQVFLEQLTRMLHAGEVPSSPIPMDVFPRILSEPIPPWPREIKDLKDQLKETTFAVRSRSLRATVWRAWTVEYRSVVVKVPRINASLENQARHDHLEYVFRKVVSSRHGIHHPNIIDFLGITSGFSPHEGLVFEECFRWSLKEYRVRKTMIPDTYARSGDLSPNYYSLICDILEGLRYMHGHPIPISQGDLTPENISVDIEGRAQISLISFGRIISSLPHNAAVTATVESVLAFRWMSPELVTSNNPQPTTESDMWMFGCVCFWLLTLQEPYASTNRDDLAGTEIMRGHPPATLASAYHMDTWITNGLWGAIGRCWRQDPLQRTSATDFMKLLAALEGRKINWLPLSVTDLAGKVRFNFSERQERNLITTHQSIWRRFGDTKYDIWEEALVELGLYKATYVPKWYSKSTNVVIKAAYPSKTKGNDVEALSSAIRHEVALMSQIEHPCIHKLLGIDSSPTHTYLPDMVFEPLSELSLQLLLGQGGAGYTKSIEILIDVASALTYLHQHIGGSIAHGDIQPANIFILPNGRAKLANFTCAFQYISGQTASTLQWSETIAVPLQPTLYLSPESRDLSAFPTSAGDVWSFGVVMLSSFSVQFRATSLDQYTANLDQGDSPINLPGIAADCDTQVYAIVKSILIFEPSNRPSIPTLLPELSGLLRP